MVERYQTGQNADAGFGTYVCPTCKGELERKGKNLLCQTCQGVYPVRRGIPDFIIEDLTQSTNPIFRNLKDFDRLATVYETWFWYHMILNIFGGLGSISRKGLVRHVREMLKTDRGMLLDAACGPGTLGRRLASPSTVVYGIDISMGMLRKGLLLAKRDHMHNVHFARAKVEQLPFREYCFDAAVCGAALHLFSDTVSALRKIGGVLKKGAPLAVTTFIAGSKGILRFRHIRQHLRKDHGIHIFQLPELEQYLSKAGFTDFDPRVYGSAIVFGARKHETTNAKDGTGTF
jgi:ubiquinone/menaquinone biosynthesis C-methylase UbiE/uncharacterized protein YbaR (Trm112 family)